MPEITSRLSTALADRYKIERHLGEGGMATVYLAEDLMLRLARVTEQTHISHVCVAHDSEDLTPLPLTSQKG